MAVGGRTLTMPCRRLSLQGSFSRVSKRKPSKKSFSLHSKHARLGFSFLFFAHTKEEVA